MNTMTVEEAAAMAADWRERSRQATERAKRAEARADKYREVARYYEWKADQAYREAMGGRTYPLTMMELFR